MIAIFSLYDLRSYAENAILSCYVAFTYVGQIIIGLIICFTYSAMHCYRPTFILRLELKLSMNLGYI